MGLHCTYVNTEICWAADRGRYSMQCVLTLRVHLTSLQGHVPGTQLNMQERVCTYLLYYLVQVDGAETFCTGALVHSYIQHR